MRQYRLLELLKIVDMSILYHQDKTNIVVDALSKMAISIGILALLRVEERPLAMEVQ